MKTCWICLLAVCLGFFSACSSTGHNGTAEAGRSSSGITVFGEVDAAVTHRR